MMMQRRIYDISLTVRPGMHVWPGNPEVALESVKSIVRGNSSNISQLHLGTHTGTHVDAPRHFIEGAAGVDALPPDVLVGRARLFQLPEARRIDSDLLRELDMGDVSRLLLGTRNSALLKRPRLDLNHVFVTEDAAHYVVDMGIGLLGMDYLSIEEYGKEGRPAHHVLLGSGVVIVEGLDLSGIAPGDYELLCLPLKLQDGDGAPARVFLREL